MEEKYLTIAEFATLVGVSKQAIYKQANNPNSQIAPFIIREGRKLLIQEAALQTVYRVEQPIQPYSTFDNLKCQPDSTQFNPECQPDSTDYIEFLKQQIAELKTEKANLNIIIQEKDNTIKEQSIQISNLAQQITEIANKALITTSQQQYLAAAEKQESILIADTTKEPKEKKGFLNRLFHK